MVGKGGRFGDADLLGPQPYPVSMKGREAHVYQVGAHSLSPFRSPYPPYAPRSPAFARN